MSPNSQLRPATRLQSEKECGHFLLFLHCVFTLLFYLLASVADDPAKARLGFGSEEEGGNRYVLTDYY